MKKKIIILTLIFLSLFVCKVYAKDYGSNKLIMDDKVVIDNDLDNSALILGNNVDLSNKIDGFGIVLGNDILFNSISDYFIMLGNNVTFNGKARDGIILGNKVVLNESSTIGRDIIILASSVSISGSINRNVEIHANDVTIKDAQISGNVKINAASIDVERNADIIGELSYNDDSNINVSDVANIGSKKTFIVEKEKKNEMLENIKSKLISYVNILVIFAILLFLLPKLFNKLDNNKKDIIKNLGIGLVALIVIPIAVIILIFTLFGMSLAILLIAMYLILIYLSTIVTGYILGNYIWEKFIKVDKKAYLVGIIGITVIYLLKLIPYIGGIITFLSVVIGEGSILALYSKKK